MNPKSTWLWLLIAAGLFGLILLREHFVPKPQTGPRKVLPGFNAAAVTAVQVQPDGKPAIHAERTNGVWRLTAPLDYPAQGAAIDGLLNTLQDLTVATRISPGELKNVPKASEEFGFNPPHSSLIIGQSNAPVRVWIGNKTAPGNQVFVQVIGNEGVDVVGAALLDQIPREANDWRDTKLVNLTHITFNRLDVTNSGKVLELRQDSTNQSWRIVQPGEARADNDRIQESLQQLQNLQVRQFVSDDPKADLESYGLQNPELSLAFKQGTNTALLLEVGRSPTNQPDLAYARLDDQKTIVKVPRDLVEPWFALHSHDFGDFIDRHLVALTTPPDAVEIRSPEDSFSLRRQTNGSWRVLPTDFPADTAMVEKFLAQLQGMQAARIEKSAVVDQSWPDYGLANPVRQFIFKDTITNAQGTATNISMAQLDFGIKDATNVFARRVGEPIVYAVAPTNLNRLTLTDIQFRERRIWKFDARDVVRLTAQRGGTNLEVLHLATNKWNLAAGSQGIINDLAIEDVAAQLGNLSAAYWVQRGDINSARYGFTEGGLRLSVELKDRRKLSVKFGGAAPSGFPYAMTVLDGVPWIFEFPWGLYQYIDLYLNPSRQTSLTHGAAQ